MENTTLAATAAILRLIKESGLDYEQRRGSLLAALTIHDADSCDLTVVGKQGTKKIEFKEDAHCL